MSQEQFDLNKKYGGKRFRKATKKEKDEFLAEGIETGKVVERTEQGELVKDEKPAEKAPKQAKNKADIQKNTEESK